MSTNEKATVDQVIGLSIPGSGENVIVQSTPNCSIVLNFKPDSVMFSRADNDLILQRDNTGSIIV